MIKDRFLKTLKFTTISLFFLLVATVFAREINCHDIWLHLGTGRYIVQNLKVPTQDIFSFTFSGIPWINHEWLFQVIVYSLYGWFGTNGLVAMRILIFVFAFGFLFRLGYRKTNYIPIILTLMMLLFILCTRNFTRPEIFSLLFVSAYLFILYRYRSSRLVYLLVPVQLLWVNIHGYSLVGIIIVFFYVIGEMIARLKMPLISTKERSIQDNNAFSRLVFVLFLLILASFINPYTYRGFFYSILTSFEFAEHSKYLQSTIAELRRPLAPDFDHVVAVWYIAMTAISAVLLIFNIKKLNLGLILLYLISFKIATSSNRNITYFGLIATVIMIASINDISASGIFKRFSKYKKPAEALVCIVLIVFMSHFIWARAVCTYYVEGTTFKSLNFGASKHQYSEGLAKFAKENNLKGNVFNDFETGAFIAGHLYPDCKSFIDGRTEVYGVELLKRHTRLESQEELLEDVADEYNIKYAMVRNLKPLGKLLKKLYRNNEWKLVYFDGIVTVFARDIKENEELIRNCELTLPVPNKPIGERDLEYLRKKKIISHLNLEKAYFYADLNLYDLAVGEMEYALRVNPDLGLYYHALGFIYAKERSYQKAISALKMAIVKGHDDLVLRSNLARTYLKMELFESAAGEYEKAIELDRGGSIPADYPESIMELKLKRNDIFENLKRDISRVKDTPGRAKLYYAAGEELFKLKCFLSAIDPLKKAIELDPQLSMDVKLSNMLALSFNETGTPLEAVGILEDVLRSNPKDALTLRNLGYFYYEKGDFTEARQLWDKALQSDPESKLTRQYLSML